MIAAAIGIGRGPTGNDQETRTPIIVILLFHIISVRKQFFLCGEYVFNRFHTITHTAHIHKHTHVHSHSHEKKNTRILYMKKLKKKTYNAYYINIRKNKKTRNQCVAIKPGKKERRRFPFKAKPCIAESFLSHNNARRNMYVRKRMNMMFLYSIIISIVLRALKKQKKTVKSYRQQQLYLCACWFHEQLQQQQQQKAVFLYFLGLHHNLFF